MSGHQWSEENDHTANGKAQQMNQQMITLGHSSQVRTAPIVHCSNAIAYLSIVADHVHPFMTTVSDDNNKFSAFKHPPQ